MKKFKALIFTLILFFVSSDFVYAVCEASETNTLNSLAVNVSASYEIVEIGVPLEEGENPPDGWDESGEEEYISYQDYFRIYISNITEELYVVVTNELTGEEQTFTYEDTENGVVSFDVGVGRFITNYTIEVYSSDETNCPDTRLYTHYLTTPMFNIYSEYSLCMGIEEFYLCHPYLSVDVDFSNVYDLIWEYRDGHIDEDGEEIVPVDEEEPEPGFGDFLLEHWTIITVVVVAIIAVGGLITFVIIKKRRSKIV